MKTINTTSLLKIAAVAAVLFSVSGSFTPAIAQFRPPMPPIPILPRPHQPPRPIGPPIHNLGK